MSEDYTKVEADIYYKLVENNDNYKKAYSTIRDLLPEKEDLDTWNKDDLEGWFEELDFILRSLEDEIYKG